MQNREARRGRREGEREVGGKGREREGGKGGGGKG